MSSGRAEITPSEGGDEAAKKYWECPADLDLTKAYWCDPAPTLRGMLSSDLIEFYNEAIGRPGMVAPFKRENLKPAAYELTLGPNCVVDGEDRILSEADPWLTIPKNSIVFVSMQERLLIPHYIVGRFDLAIEFIYKGILLGTGPQVDPGFQGVLSTPLHNISSEPIHIRLHYPFAKIDFTKSENLAAALASGRLDEIETEDELYAAAATLAAYQGKHVTLFKPSNRWREPIHSPAYAGQRRVKSSLSDLEARIDGFRLEISESEDEITKIRRFGLGAGLAVVLAVITIMIALAELDRSYTDAKVDAVETREEGAARAADAATAEVSALRAEVARLTRRVSELERRPR